MPERQPKYHYREAFVKAPTLGLNPIKVERISDGIAVLKAIGEGKLCVCTRTRPKTGGYYAMAECDLRELSGKTEDAIYALLDKKTDQLSLKVDGKYVLEDRIKT
jgi:hypothetical protein